MWLPKIIGSSEALVSENLLECLFPELVRQLRHSPFLFVSPENQSLQCFHDHMLIIGHMLLKYKSCHLAAQNLPVASHCAQYSLNFQVEPLLSTSSPEHIHTKNIISLLQIF